MTHMVAVIIFAACIGVFLVGLFWYGLRGEQNVDPALGSNLPYPGGIRTDGSRPVLHADLSTSPSVMPRQFRRNADRS